MEHSKSRTTSNKNFGFVRVATATPKLKVGNPDYNSEEIVRLLREAQSHNTQAIFFPELSITGYTCGDLFHNFELIEGAQAGLEKVRQASLDFSGILFIGLPMLVDNVLYNCVAAIHAGRLLGIIPKTYLPNAGEFYEWRWFSPSDSAIQDHIVFGGERVPFGTDLLFCADNITGFTIGIDVCEDGWAVDPPSVEHAIMGATIIGNLSASPEWVSKQEYRRTLFTMRSATLIAAYVYTSAGVHESTSDLVFSGHQLICENGSLLAQCKPFSRESKVTIADVDLERLIADRMRIKNFADARRRLRRRPEYRRIHFTATVPDRSSLTNLMRPVDPRPFVPRDSLQLNERCDDIFNIQVAGLAKRLEQLGSSPTIVIGVSGGLDSTLALLVASRTMDLLGLQRANIRGFTMPGFGTTLRTKNNAISLMKELGITVEPVADIRAACMEEMRQMGHKPFGSIDINAIYLHASRTAEGGKPFSLESHQAAALELFSQELSRLPSGSQDLTFENVQARMRTKILMDSGFVLGTGDLSELALGWCTYNGDHMSMYNVNAGVPKTLVRFLVKWAAEHLFSGESRRVLIDIFETEISPELLPANQDGEITQKTESLIGPYELHDFFLYNLLRFGFRPEKILFLAEHADFDGQYRIDEIRSWLKVFIQRFFRNQFKRNCLPDGPKVGSICLSPRGDWRMPSDADEKLWLGWTEEKSINRSVAKTRVLATQSDRVLRVLLRVDEQLDFMPGGTLAVKNGDEVVPVSNALSQSGYYQIIVDSMDDHPVDHGSFASQYKGKRPFVDRVVLSGVDQQLWPDHCVHGTAGWRFHPDLDRSMVARTFAKGQDRRVDSYSAFYDNGRQSTENGKDHPFLGRSTGLADYLRERATEAGAEQIQVDLVGLAVPYCVSYSARDASVELYKGHPFRVRVVVDGVRAMADTQQQFDSYLQEMAAEGIELVYSEQVLSERAGGTIRDISNINM